MKDYGEQSGALRAPGRGHTPTPSTDRFSRARPLDSAFRSGTRRRPSRTAVGLALAILRAVAALVIALVSLFSQPSPAAGPWARVAPALLDRSPRVRMDTGKPAIGRASS